MADRQCAKADCKRYHTSSAVLFGCRSAPGSGVLSRLDSDVTTAAAGARSLLPMRRRHASSPLFCSDASLRATQTQHTDDVNTLKKLSTEGTILIKLISTCKKSFVEFTIENIYKMAVVLFTYQRSRRHLPSAVATQWRLSPPLSRWASPAACDDVSAR